MLQVNDTGVIMFSSFCQQGQDKKENITKEEENEVVGWGRMME